MVFVAWIRGLAHFQTTLGPARPLAITWNGAGAWLIFSQSPQVMIEHLSCPGRSGTNEISRAKFFDGPKRSRMSHIALTTSIFVSSLRPPMLYVSPAMPRSNACKRSSMIAYIQPIGNIASLARDLFPSRPMPE